jgi:hypothetical protein
MKETQASLLKKAAPSVPGLREGNQKGEVCALQPPLQKVIDERDGGDTNQEWGKKECEGVLPEHLEANR